MSLHGLRIKFPVANSVRIFGSVCAAADAIFAVRLMWREDKYCNCVSDSWSH